MKKIALTLNCIILLMLCQVVAISPVTKAISDTQKKSISTNCQQIKVNLKSVQKNDARARVYLGSYYETILTRFVTPLNIRLVENNLSNASLVENQNKFAEAKTIFTNDYIKYQQYLEELVAIDCEAEPDKFYEKLESVRRRRQTMEQDVLKLRTLISDHVKLVNNLKGKL